VAAATSTASALGLTVDEAIVLHASNRLALRLLPSDVLARVAHIRHGAAQLEVDLATRLANTDSPVAALDSRVAPRVYERDGFAITLWTYYPAQPSRELSPAAYADALVRLHAGLQRVDLATPHFTDRVQEAAGLVGSRELTPELGDADRNLLTNTFNTVTGAIRERGAAEQLLHGEPHPGNVLNTKSGPLFVDLETCCRGPVEFDLAHVPEEVSERYPNIDQALLRHCRILVLAMVAAWRFDPADQLPSGRQVARELLTALRAGPPYPALGAITGLN
jgi:Ser/Thr protein kinase RdoA (MazF antagonist)